ncbi:hypothetical protein AB0A76_07490 [Streptomyces exfoliatus]|uniref:Uncharacterized protein n=1 Tax=Streptomyces exfoliatus TaxID=1905 RepID=A0ABV3CSZ6_STREX
MNATFRRGTALVIVGETGSRLAGRPCGGEDSEVALGFAEGGADELGDVRVDPGAAVELPFVGQDRGDETEAGLGGRGVEVRDMGLVPMEVPLVNDEAPVHDQ